MTCRIYKDRRKYKTTKDIDDTKANHGYDSSPKTLKEVEDIAKATFGRLMPLNPQNINFDVTNNQLIISGTNRLPTAKGYISVASANGTIEMPTATNAYRIEFNPTLSSWEIKSAHERLY